MQDLFAETIFVGSELPGLFCLEDTVSVESFPIFDTDNAITSFSA